MEGDDAQALGQLRSFTEALFGLDARLRERRPLSKWVESLYTVLDQFFAPRGREENEIQMIRAALETLRANADLAHFTDPVGLNVVKSTLRNQMNASESVAGRFLSGSVTFCAIVPMRSIPFNIVCLIGMSDDAYPRSHRPVDFDLMANSFRRGDRSRRQDDRYLFLETLLSARRCLYLSYVGQSIRDNTTLPASVLVGELLDVVNRGFHGANRGLASEQIVVRHFLQAFSPRYFMGDQRLFSYSRELAEASRHAGRGEQEAAPLLTTELPEPEAMLRRVTLEELLRFFRNPVQWLLRERLGIRPDEDKEALETREPFVLDRLENHDLLQQMLELYREGQALTEIQAVVQGSGSLPHGQVGECVFIEARERMTRFAGRLGRVLPRRELEALDINLAFGEFRLTGRLTGMTLTGRVGYRLASMKANDVLNLWLHHLALNAMAPEGAVLQSYWVAEDKDVILEPVKNPELLLRALLDLYWQGTRRLLHFFPKSALAYVEKLQRGKTGEEALRAARLVWEGSGYQSFPPESANTYYQLAFQDIDPLDVAFIDVAQMVFIPVFGCMLQNPPPS